MERANGPAFSPNKICGREIVGRRIRVFGAPSGSERQELERGCHEVMLASVNGQAPKNQQSVGTEVQAVMAELVVRRKILLNVLFRQANGQSLTAQEMQGLIDRADSDKLKKARERSR